MARFVDITEFNDPTWEIYANPLVPIPQNQKFQKEKKSKNLDREFKYMAGERENQRVSGQLTEDG